MATKKSTAVAETKNTAVGTYDYGSRSGAGMENISKNELTIPFIYILQSNSPEVQQCEDGSVRMGMLKNTVTGEIFDGKEGFVFIPCHREGFFVEWVPRKMGGGLVGQHAPESDIVQQAIEINGGRMPKRDANGDKIPLRVPGGTNELVETFYLYGLMMDAEGENVEGFAVIPFTSTKIGAYKKIITNMSMVRGNPPIYANRLRFTTIREENNDGAWAKFEIKPAFGKTLVESLVPPERNDILDYAEDFIKMIEGGEAKADEAGARNEDGSSGGGTAKANTDSEEMPF